MTARGDFVERFGGVFEHSPFIAERAYDAGLILIPLTAKGVHQAMASVFRKASDEEKIGVLRAHPDLAGKLAIAGELTEDSKREQAGAGLTGCHRPSMRGLRRLMRPIRKNSAFPSSSR